MSDWSVGDVLPHGGDMILLDHVETYGADDIVCTRTVRRGDAFVADDGSLPAWVGVELMAQTIAAWAGCHARDAGQDVRLGFLLGARSYRCNVDAFANGSTLRIVATRQFNDAGGMGVFACTIAGPEVEAQARLTVFSPPDTAVFTQSGHSDIHHD